jgi:hypothetical protein
MTQFSWVQDTLPRTLEKPGQEFSASHRQFFCLVDSCRSGKLEIDRYSLCDATLLSSVAGNVAIELPGTAVR